MMVVLSGFFLALIAFSSSVFIVDQKSHAMFSFGEVKSVVSEPGLHL
jgi:regulator of protease activity HflC (stomatin/prohibitin superfamily)